MIPFFPFKKASFETTIADAFVSEIYFLYLGLSKKVMVPDLPF